MGATVEADAVLPLPLEPPFEGLTTMSNPNPVNLAGEVLYRSILGRMTGRVLVSPLGEPDGPNGMGWSWSIADMEARELKVDALRSGGEKWAMGVADVAGVTVATDAPRDRPSVGDTVDQGDEVAEAASDIRRGSVVGE